MSTPTPRRSAPGPTIASYLALKQDLGHQYCSETAVSWLTSTVFCGLSGRHAHLRRNASWALTLVHLTLTVRRSRMRIVRNLCLCAGSEPTRTVLCLIRARFPRRAHRDDHSSSPWSRLARSCARPRRSAALSASASLPRCAPRSAVWRRTRQELLQATERLLALIVQATTRATRRLSGKGPDRPAGRQGDRQVQDGQALHLEITDTSFSCRRNIEAIEAEAALDGLYIVRTSLSADELDAEATVRRYKGLS